MVLKVRLELDEDWELPTLDTVEQEWKVSHRECILVFVLWIVDGVNKAIR